MPLGEEISTANLGCWETINRKEHRSNVYLGEGKADEKGEFWAGRLAGLSLAAIKATQGVEGKEAQRSRSCALINMREVILLLECINLPCVPGM